MQASIAEPLTVPAGHARVRATAVLGGIVFFAFVGLMVIAAVPYGSVEMWWKAFFVCATFTLGIIWLIEGFIRGQWISDGGAVVLPIVALAGYALLQTVSFGTSTAPAGVALANNAISFDPYQTRFFALQLLAVALVCIFLFNYANTERRWRILINVVIGIAVASAIFGILRQTTQTNTGFVLPVIKLQQGYGQFFNRNHFAFLMEMALGLGLGMTVAGGVKRDQALIYFAALLPLWTALVLCSSRAGLVAMAAQVVVAALLFGLMNRDRWTEEPESRLARLVQSRLAQLALLVVLLFGIAVGTLWLGGDQLVERIQESRTDFNSDTDEIRAAVSRNEIWRLSAQMFAERPLTGVGMGAYWAVVPRYHNGSGRMTPQEAHNDYLELMASGGIVALALFIWFAVVVFRRTRASLTHRSSFRRAAAFGAAVGITGVAIHSLFDFGLHLSANAMIFAVLIVLATAQPPLKTRERQSI